jgi:hypothetical protein
MPIGSPSFTGGLALDSRASVGREVCGTLHADDAARGGYVHDVVRRRSGLHFERREVYSLRWR